ncbi:MAG: ABC transporter ATP-binding protein [Candidatus Bathyarchaeia archaeon]
MALDHLNLTVNQGEVFGFLGPNGAGKTTTILLLMGLSMPTSGTANVLGYDIIRESREIRRNVGLLPESAGYYEDLSAQKNLEYIGLLNDLSKTESEKRAKELLETVGLKDWGGTPVEKFSRGMKQRLGIAQALVKRPKLLILDEPTIGLDPVGTREIRELILRLNKEQGLTIFVSSHLLHEIQMTCTHMGMINHGRLIVSDELKNLTELLAENEGLRLELKIHNKTPDLLKEIEGIEGVSRVLEKGDMVYVNMRSDVTLEISKTITKNGAYVLLMKPREYSLEDIFMKYYKEV